MPKPFPGDRMAVGKESWATFKRRPHDEARRLKQPHRISVDEPLHRLPFFHGPFFRVLFMSGRGMQLDMFPEFGLGFSRELSGASFHSRIIPTLI